MNKPQTSTRPFQKAAVLEIEVDGWFCISKNYPPLDRMLLDDSLFKRSVRRFDVGNLRVTDIQRLQGSWLNSKEVIGVVDTKGSLIPFFIDRQKVEKLQSLIDSVKNPKIVKL